MDVLFKKFDLDHSGTIANDEFYQGLNLGDGSFDEQDAAA